MSARDRNMFRMDLTYLLRIAEHIDHMYASNDRQTYHYLKKFRRVIDEFNEKYSKLHVALDKGHLSVGLKVFLKESLRGTVDGFSKDIKDNIFGEGSLNVKYTPSSINTLPAEIINALTLEKDARRNMVELIYRSDTLANPQSPEYQILQHHALEQMNTNINLRDKHDEVFSFDIDTDSETGGIFLSNHLVGEVN